MCHCIQRPSTVAIRSIKVIGIQIINIAVYESIALHGVQRAAQSAVGVRRASHQRGGQKFFVGRRRIEAVRQIAGRSRGVRVQLLICVAVRRVQIVQIA